LLSKNTKNSALDSYYQTPVKPGGWTATEGFAVEKPGERKMRVGLCAIGAKLPKSAPKEVPWTRAIVASAVLGPKAARGKGGVVRAGAEMNIAVTLDCRK
jgi:hypothetical protein